MFRRPSPSILPALSVVVAVAVVELVLVGGLRQMSSFVSHDVRRGSVAFVVRLVVGQDLLDVVMGQVLVVVVICGVVLLIVVVL